MNGQVGAADDLKNDQSTFMMEMIETAQILSSATQRSLVILDEIGRGTSTTDGLAIAQAVLEHLHDHTQCRTLFATHYHELTELISFLPRMSLHRMAVQEENGRVVFLHKVLSGAASKSYGVHVARLAGLPASVLVRAEALLESGYREKQKEREDRENEEKVQRMKGIIDRLNEIQADQLSPKAALDLLYQLKDQIKTAK